MTFILLVGQAAISSAGLLMLRYSMPLILDRATPTNLASFGWALFGMVLYGVSFLLWLFILSRNPVSFAYPITVGLTLALTVVGSHLLLGERVSLLQIGGIVLMAASVLLLSIDGPRASSGAMP